MVFYVLYVLLILKTFTLFGQRNNHEKYIVVEYGLKLTKLIYTLFKTFYLQYVRAFIKNEHFVGYLMRMHSRKKA